MNAAKIQLSPDELLLVQNGQWILTKNAIIQKVYHLFGSLAEEMKNITAKNNLPAEVLQTTPKISKGENYKGLPYVMLDHPRLFTKENVFAVRTFFWWANYFSITLHLKGAYKEKFSEAIQKNIFLLNENNFYLSITEDEWHHDIDERNYILLNDLDNHLKQKYFLQSPLLKISAKINLDKWNESESRLLHLYNVILKCLEN
ncbi:MAG TPA: hypothetical protein VK787_15575 [Puia sp.]|jgi:hypothetical protein|nr:hypothetical protein [Puia sp.]